MADFKPGTSIKTLRDRAELLNKTRKFFQERNYLEVETPALAKFPSLDLHLDLFSTKSSRHYLITSPEYHMKRLLASGSGSIFQICKAFRYEEAGQLHNPEFTIIEWYHEGWTDLELMEEVSELMTLLLKTEKADKITYEEAFNKYIGLDPFKLTYKEFSRFLNDRNELIPDFLMDQNISRDELLNYLLAVFIEPNLGKERPEFLYNYPLSQANLAKVNQKDPRTAARFELYYKGWELCNGFYELQDPVIQRARFEEENRLRKEAKKEEYPIDEPFIAALEAGLPDCAGVAVGFDRVVMLALEKESIDEVISFSWKRC